MFLSHTRENLRTSPLGSTSFNVSHQAVFKTRLGTATRLSPRCTTQPNTRMNTHNEHTLSSVHNNNRSVPSNANARLLLNTQAHTYHTTPPRLDPTRPDSMSYLPKARSSVPNSNNCCARGAAVGSSSSFVVRCLLFVVGATRSGACQRSVSHYKSNFRNGAQRLLFRGHCSAMESLPNLYRRSFLQSGHLPPLPSPPPAGSHHQPYSTATFAIFAASQFRGFRCSAFGVRRSAFGGDVPYRRRRSLLLVDGCWSFVVVVNRGDGTVMVDLHGRCCCCCV